MTAIRLQRYLSQSGVSSRRRAEELIQDGAVTVNGKVVTELGTKVEPGVDRVCVDGKAVYPQDQFYVLFNKPKGCITTVSDPEGRLTVMDFLRNVPVPVAPVGRLDFYSEGVLLLTNDGELSARLQSPEHHVEKTYHVKVRGHVSEGHLEALRTGVRLDDGFTTQPAQVDRLRSKSRHDWLVITLTEGKTRQIHRMLESLGYTVLKIQRVAFAGLTFHGLRVGDARELTQSEVNELRSMVGLPKNTVSRGKWSIKREDTELGRRARMRQLAEAALPGDEDARGAARPARSTERPARGAARPARGAERPARGTERPARGTARPARGTEWPARGSARPAGGPARPARGTERPAARGTERPARGTERTARGTGRPAGGTAGAARGTGRPARGPARPAKSPARPARGPGRPERGAEPRGSSRPAKSRSRPRGASQKPPPRPTRR